MTFLDRLLGRKKEEKKTDTWEREQSIELLVKLVAEDLIKNPTTWKQNKHIYQDGPEFSKNGVRFCVSKRSGSNKFHIFFYEPSEVYLSTEQNNRLSQIFEMWEEAEKHNKLITSINRFKSGDKV